MTKTANLIILTLLLVLLSQSILALEFIENPSINNNQKPFLTTEDLVCSWSSSGDTSNTIKWYLAEGNSVPFYIKSGATTDTIHNSEVFRGHNWICEVTINNGTESISMNSSIIRLIPWLSFSNNSIVSENYELNESVIYEFYINSADPTLSNVAYSILSQNSSSVCSVSDSSSGRITCEVNHEHVAGTPLPGPENITSFDMNITVWASSIGTQSNVSFTLIPVNNQANFTNNTKSELENLVIEANSVFSFNVTGYDEEADYNLSFSIVSVNPGVGTSGNLSSIYFSADNSTEISQLLIIEPTNAHVGNWSIELSVQDNGSSSFPPSFFTFNVEILRDKVIPELLTNLSNLNMSGIQGENFSLNISAWDPNELGYTIKFNFVQPTNETNPFCASTNFIWDELIITYLNSSSYNTTVNLFFENLLNDHVVCRFTNIEIYFEEDNGLKHTEENVFFNITNINDLPEIHEISSYVENIGQNISNLSVRLKSPSVYRVNASDVDDLTYDSVNTGFLNFTTNNSLFPINNLTGLMNLTFLDPSFVGNHEINITVMDKMGATYSRIMNLTIKNNTAPILAVPEFINDSLQNNITNIFFNATDFEDVLVNKVEFYSNNGLFDNDIYNHNSSLSIISSVNISDGFNVTTFALNLSNWVLYQANISGAPVEYYANKLVGQHDVAIWVYDEFDTHDSVDSRKNISFFIENENDAPFFVKNKDDNSYTGDEIEFLVVIGEQFSKNIFVTDFDLYLPDSEENLTFSIIENNTSPQLNDISFVKVNNDEALLSFIVNLAGNYNITLNVTDSFNVSDILTINFNVYNSTSPLEFTKIRPYLDFEESLVTHMLGDIEVGESYLNIYWTENQSLIFDAEINFDETLKSPTGVDINNFLNIEWFINNESVSTHNEVNNLNDFSISHYFNFFSANVNLNNLDEGINNITIYAVDRGGSSASWTWFVNVTDVPRDAIYCEGSLNNYLEVNMGLEVEYFLSRFNKNWKVPNSNINLTQRFYHPDDDISNTGPETIDPCVPGFSGVSALNSLEFDYEITNGNCNADISIEGSNLIIIGKGESACELKFIARDLIRPSISYESTDKVFVSIFGEFEIERRVTVIERVFVPYEQQVFVPSPTKVIYPGNLIFYQNQTVDVPLLIKNNWTEDFENIRLSANLLNASNDVEINTTFSFSVNEIRSLAKGSEQEVILTLYNYRSTSPLRVNIFADIASPAFIDSETLVVASLEMASDDSHSVRALVTYARDLLMTSSECIELNDLLDHAQNMLDSGLSEEALLMVDGAINGCKHLLSQEEILRSERPSSFKMGLSFTSEYWLEIVFSAIALIFVAIVFYVFAFVRLYLKNK